jgi:DNA-directed RNA polymerase specialized sigma24 family protein
MTTASPDTDELLVRTANGDWAARDQLITRHRARLRKMVAYHLDRRLRARVDPSDVVQEVLVEASRKLPEYLGQRPLSVAETAAVLGISEAAVKTRHVRALQRLRELLDEPGDYQP